VVELWERSGCGNFGPKGAGGLSPGFQPWDDMKTVRPEGARGYWKRVSNRDHLKPIYFYYGVVSTLGLGVLDWGWRPFARMEKG
jgi:hypothetical protein